MVNRYIQIHLVVSLSWSKMLLYSHMHYHKKNKDPDCNGMAQLMETLAIQQEGYIDHDAARNEVGISFSYQKS